MVYLQDNINKTGANNKVLIRLLWAAPRVVVSAGQEMKARRTECLAAFWQPLELSLLHFKAQKQFFRRTAFLVVFEKVPSKQEDFDWQFKIRTLIMSDQRGLRPPHLRALCVKLCALCGLIKWQEQRKWKRYATVFFWDSKDTSYRLLATNYLRFLRNDKQDGKIKALS